MNKNDAINIVVENIYNNDTSLTLTETEIKNINEIYKKELLNLDEGFEKIIEQYQNELGKINKLKSGKLEMQKQLEKHNALQPGILSECNYSETLARVFGLNKCVDLERATLKEIPSDCIPYVQASASSMSSGRYLYYNPKKDIYLFQYGNPVAGDAEIVIEGIKLKVEFKENVAKSGEYDINGLYDESGRLLISDSFKNKTPELIPFIEKFNEDTNVIDEIGHNYNSFDENTKINAIHEYFLKHDIDVLVSATNDNNLIVVTPDCLDVVLPDGSRFISTENSEIRTSGRNYRKLYTEDLFNKTLELMEAIKINEEKFQVSMDNEHVEKVTARGKNKISRIKFRKIFFIKIENAEIKDNDVIFNIKDVMQLVPSISMHIKIEASKKQLKEYYEDKQ